MGQLIFGAAPRLAEWESAMSAGLLPMSLAVTEGEQGELPRMTSRYRRIADFRAGGISIQGVASNADNSAGAGYLKILFLTNGRGEMLRDGASIPLEVGTWILYDPARPYRIDPVGQYDCVALAMPIGAALMIRTVRVRCPPLLERLKWSDWLVR